MKISPFWGDHNLFSGIALSKDIHVGFPISGFIPGIYPLIQVDNGASIRGILKGLFVTLHAEFLAVIQILVYAGAILVLYLFVVMLLNLKRE